MTTGFDRTFWILLFSLFLAPCEARITLSILKSSLSHTFSLSLSLFLLFAALQIGCHFTGFWDPKYLCYLVAYMFCCLVCVVSLWTGLGASSMAGGVGKTVVLLFGDW
jgi:hypothetical protein